jgi:pimeloyl-ACP methyl ester carboxylesterase
LRVVPPTEWHTTEVEGARVRWLEAGEGDPLLFLHGWGMSPRAYARAVTPLCRAGIRVIAPALPGFGGSTAPALRHVSLDEYASRVAAFADVLDLGRPAFVMGHSLGGGVAIRLASTRPDLVRSLTLLNSVGGAPGVRTGMTSRPWWQWAVGAFAEADPRLLFSSRQVVYDVVRDFVPNIARRPVTAALTAYLALSADLADDAQRLVDDGLPVLFVWGDRDRLITPGAFAEIAVSPEIVKGRHGWLLTAPDEFAQLLHNALVVHAMLERSRRGQRPEPPDEGALFPPERRHRARRGDTGTRSAT